MWFPARHKDFGSVPKGAFEVFRSAVLSLNEEAWTAGNKIKERLAGDRPTNSVFLWSLDTARFPEFMENGGIQQKDVDFDDSFGLYELAQPLLEVIRSSVGENCIVSMMQIARMQPGSRIAPHYDSNPVLIASHRLHIPLITNDKLRFIVDDERIVMEEGKLYELNNQLVHHVDNPKDAQTRIHLIVDLLPDHFNNTGLASQRLEFEVRRYQRPVDEPRAARSIKLPPLIATSVIRGANKSESHGGIYLVDMQKGKSRQVINWDDMDIEFEGRGLDRGLRGVAFYNGRILVAATKAICEFDRQFKLINKYESPYLRHAHEISVDGKYLFVSSTGFDSVLRLNLKRGEYDKGWSFGRGQHLTNFVEFDPRKSTAECPTESNRYHINNVFAHKGQLFICGRKMGNVVSLKGDTCKALARTPPGTHNVQPFGKGFLYNDSEADRVVYSHRYDYRRFDIPRYQQAELQNTEFADGRLARQAFGRGLCQYKDGIVFAGSSPSTITAYDFKTRRVVKSVNITMDVRNAIHGLEIWPY